MNVRKVYLSLKEPDSFIDQIKTRIVRAD